MKEFAKVGAVLIALYLVMIGAFQLVAFIDRTDVTHYEDGSTKIIISNKGE
jgi:hypothetical protein